MGVADFVHHSHAALTELLDDSVVAQGGSNHFGHKISIPFLAALSESAFRVDFASPQLGRINRIVVG
jgi:hypothetical protein